MPSATFVLNPLMHQPVNVQMIRGELTRHDSTSSTATFDLPSENRSPLPETEPNAPISADKELAGLRADKEHLTTIIADMQYVYRH